MKKKSTWINITGFAGGVILLTLVSAMLIGLFNLASTYQTSKNGNYEMVKIDQFEIKEFNSDKFLVLTEFKNNEPSFQYLQQSGGNYNLGLTPASRTTIVEATESYRVEVYQKKPNFWSDSYFTFVIKSGLYNYENIEYMIYIPSTELIKAD